MKNPRNISTFLSGFNTGAILTTISVADILFLSQDSKRFFAILVMVIINGAVIGVVMQYILIHTNITRNMVFSFINAEHKIPKRLLKLRDGNIGETLKMMSHIQLNIKKNLFVLVGLIILVLLSLCLPIAYGIKMNSNFVIFSIGWSVLLCSRIIIRALIYINNSRYLIIKINHIFDDYQFNLNECSQNKLNDDQEI